MNVEIKKEEITGGIAVDFIILGFMGVAAGFYWLRNSQKDSNRKRIKYLGGISGLGAGLYLLYTGLIKIFKG